MREFLMAIAASLTLVQAAVWTTGSEPAQLARAPISSDLTTLAAASVNVPCIATIQTAAFQTHQAPGACWLRRVTLPENASLQN